MSHTCLYLLSYSWYSFTDPGGMEGEVGLSGWLRVRQFTCQKAVTHPITNRVQCRATALIETNAPYRHRKYRACVLSPVAPVRVRIFF